MKHCIDCSYWLFCDPAEDCAKTCEDYTEDPKIKEDIRLFLCPKEELLKELTP